MPAHDRGYYSPLPGESGDTDHLLEYEPDRQANGQIQPRTGFSTKPVIRAAIVVALVVICLSAVSSALLGISQNLAQSISKPVKLSELRRPSAYPRLAGGAPDPKGPNSMFPKLMVQVSRDEPTKALGSGATVHIESGIRAMIMQYKVAQTDFHTCTVAFIAPPPSKNTKALRLEGDTSAIEVWNLTAPQTAGHLEDVTWANRPPRQNFVGTLNATQALDEDTMQRYAAGGTFIATERFPCMPGSWHVFELTCGAPDCVVQFEQLFTLQR